VRARFLKLSATMHNQPSVEHYMTRTVHSVGRKQSLQTAHDMMRKHQIRHLPVLEGGKLVGLVSLRDLTLIEGLPDVDPAQVMVEEAMTQVPYTVSRDTELALVADEMARRKLGSAVVVQGGKVIGVFTTVDALRALSDALAELAAGSRGSKEAPASATG
jgi:acetoin utilization protein AcuB